MGCCTRFAARLLKVLHPLSLWLCLSPNSHSYPPRVRAKQPRHSERPLMDVLISVGTPYPSRHPWEHRFPPLPNSYPSVKQALLIPARVISLSGSTDSVLLTRNIASCMPCAGKDPVYIPSVYTWVLGWITEPLRSADRTEPVVGDPQIHFPLS